MRLTKATQTWEILSDITEAFLLRALICNKILRRNCSSGITARHGGNQAESDRQRFEECWRVISLFRAIGGVDGEDKSRDPGGLMEEKGNGPAKPNFLQNTHSERWVINTCFFRMSVLQTLSITPEWWNEKRVAPSLVRTCFAALGGERLDSSLMWGQKEVEAKMKEHP